MLEEFWLICPLYGEKCKYQIEEEFGPYCDYYGKYIRDLKGVKCSTNSDQ